MLEITSELQVNFLLLLLLLNIVARDVWLSCSNDNEAAEPAERDEGDVELEMSNLLVDLPVILFVELRRRLPISDDNLHPLLSLIMNEFG